MKNVKKPMKVNKKRMITNIATSLTIAIVISVLTAKILPLIYIGARLAIGLVITKIVSV